MQIHIQRGEETLGPFSLEETTQYLTEGSLVESDLAWHEGLEEWMPVGQVCTQLTARTQAPGAAAVAEIPREAPTTFGQGRYRCQQLLGEGGMGQVWLVYDEQLDRPVALKTLHQRSAADIEALKELKEEVQKCLELTHPNIIRIYDLAEPPGEDTFISMEYVSGEDLHEKLKQHPEGRFSWKEIEPYALSLCDALEYAHDQGMVHRDLKPQNLIVTQENELKLADFGIAAPATSDGEEAVPRAGTPIYWGPQQAQGMTPAPTDDIYSFGITLYNLLVGQAPFLGANEPEITRQHVEDQPMHPQKKLEELGGKGKIPGYVSDLILKCLAKKPTERFRGAGEVRAWLKAKGDPVAKKQKRMAMVAVASVVLMLVMGALSVWAMMQKKEAVKQRGVAETKQKEAEAAREAEAREKEKFKRENYFSTIGLAQSKIDAGAYDKAQAALWSTPPKLRNWVWGNLIHRSHPDLATLQGHEDFVRSVAWSPDGRRVVTGSKDKTAKLWDANSGKELLSLRGHSSMLSSVAFSQDGRRVMTGGHYDQTVRIWDVENGRELLTIKVHGRNIPAFAFSPDGKRVVTGNQKTANIWDVETGKELLTLKGHIIAIRSVAFSSDGRRVVTGSGDKTAKLWDVDSGKELLTLKGHGNAIGSVAFSPDGRLVATGSEDRTVKIWDAINGMDLLTLYGHEHTVSSVAFSPDGQHLASGGKDKTIRVWDTSSGELLQTHKGHSLQVTSVAWSPDGKRLASCSNDKTIKIWDVSLSGRELSNLQGYARSPLSVAWNPDGKRLAIGARAVTMIWNEADSQPLHAQRNEKVPNNQLRPSGDVAWSPDGKRLARGYMDVEVWESDTGKKLLALKTNAKIPIHSLAWSPDGRRVVSGDGRQVARIWDAVNGTELLVFKEHKGSGMGTYSVTYSPDGRRLASGGKDKTIKIWDAASGKEFITLRGHTDQILSVAWSPDGRRLASGCEDATIKIWDPDSGKLHHTLQGHSLKVNCVAWSPDGQHLASCGDMNIKIWAAASGKEALTLQWHKGNVHSVAWSPDGRRLVSAASTSSFGAATKHQKLIKIWETIDWTLTKEEVEKQKQERYQAWLKNNEATK